VGNVGRKSDEYRALLTEVDLSTRQGQGCNRTSDSDGCRWAIEAEKSDATKLLHLVAEIRRAEVNSHCEVAKLSISIRTENTGR
jgi:hypothetical protein